MLVIVWSVRNEELHATHIRYYAKSSVIGDRTYICESWEQVCGGNKRVFLYNLVKFDLFNHFHLLYNRICFKQLSFVIFSNLGLFFNTSLAE